MLTTLRTNLTLDHFINGRDTAEGAADRSPVYNPTTGEVMAQAAFGSARDVDIAVAAAHDAFTSWSRTAPAERARLLRGLGDLIEDRVKELAEAESDNVGKSMSSAHAEVLASAELFHFYAGLAARVLGQQIPMPDPRQLCYTVLKPVGVVAAITPWNYPLLIAAGKVASAVAVGCAVVAKPAPETPVTTVMLAKLAHEAGLPPGVINVVSGGDETGAALAGHSGLAKVTFTGSTDAGRQVAQSAGRLGHAVVMELGGKSPNIVFDDIDVAANIESILMGGLANAGQECCAGARLLVHERVIDEFCDAARRWLENVQVGPGSGEAVIGPLISERHRERVRGLVSRALADGATVLAQANAPDVGFFHSPMLLRGVRADMEICREEVFGPVLTIDTFRDDDEAIAKGNGSRYGLAAGVWTADLGRALRCADELEAGMVWINCYLAGDPAAPFGGTKDSGFGREIGDVGALEFVAPKTVYMQAPSASGGVGAAR